MSYQKPQVLAGNQTEKLYATIPGMSKNGDLVPCCLGPLK